MIHPIYRVTHCSCVAPYTLALRFDDGVETTVDLREVLEGEIYGRLKDPLLFAQVSVDTEIGTVVWPGGADFDPAILHDWAAHREAFVAAASGWKNSATSRVADGSMQYEAEWKSD